MPVPPPAADGPMPIRAVHEAEGYLAKICFKTGPPALTGVELEWTVHDAEDPSRPVTPERLGKALGPHTPTVLDPASVSAPLPYGGVVSIEPGGQVEISTSPHRSIGALHGSTDADIRHLRDLLGAAGLVLGGTGIDPYRAPRPFLETRRYRAMGHAFDRRGAGGRTMMYSTAGLQICLDAGEPHRFVDRWQVAHLLGPPLLAAFATARRHAGRDTGWRSARMAAWLAIDPARTRPVWTPRGTADPVAAWTAYALDAPLLCLRRPGDDWTAPDGLTFRDWIDGALPGPPDTDDLDYHLSTLFPPVRPRGYLEIRYLDAQPGDEWIAPVAVLAALLADQTTREMAREACEPVAGRWRDAARYGLADAALATAAHRVLDVALRALDRTGLPPATRAEIDRIVQHRLASGS